VQKDINIDIGLFLNLADYFLDGLIVDIFVQSQVNRALDRTRQLRRRVGELLKELDQMQALNQERMEQLSRKRNSYC
jgi:hypothetical protein